MDRIRDQRKSALLARRRLTPQQRRSASIRACRHLARLTPVRNAQRIGLYWPLASEIDPRPVRHLLPPGTQFFLPRVGSDILHFVEWTPNLRWRYSTLGVREPMGGRGHDPSILDALIMPLAGFDQSAYRIGLGGGFYDRSLAPFRHRAYRGPQRIGLAFDCQRLDQIKPQPWDVELACVVSERGVYRRATRCRVKRQQALHSAT